MFRKSRLFSTLVSLFLLSFTAVANALDVSVYFLPDTQTGNPGDTLLYSAVFTNNTPDDVTFVFAGLNLPDAPVGSEDLIVGYMNDSSFTIGPGETTRTDIFGIYLDPALANSPAYRTKYEGLGSFVTLEGDEVENGLSFTIPPSPEAVPEPAFYQMSALLALGATGIWRFHRKR